MNQKLLRAFEHLQKMSDDYRSRESEFLRDEGVGISFALAYLRGYFEEELKEAALEA